jgi:hypothetical protein
MFVAHLCISVLKPEAIPELSYYRHRWFQEVAAPRFQDSRYKKVVRLSALLNGVAFTPKKYSWYSFLSDVKSTLGP